MDYFDKRDLLNEETENITGESEIQKFFCGKNILITGATGYIGTLVLEKLLRDCQGLQKIYILFRGTRKQSLQERIDDFFNNDEIFFRMKLENPHYYEQVEIIEGDLISDNWGLAEETIFTLLNSIHVIFHIAATVRFDEPLDYAYKVNVKGLKTILNLAEKMPHLQSFVHVSTAYSQCERRQIDECFYDPLFKDEEMQTILHSTSREEQAVLSSVILGPKPNSYVLTKSIAEDVIKEYLHLPICIVRPSVVMPTLHEPMPIWTRPGNSVMALMMGVGLGVIRVAPCMPDIAVDFTPGDLTINCIIATAWERARNKEAAIIYNSVGYENRILLKKFLFDVYYACINSEETTDAVIWKNHLVPTNNTFELYFLYYLLHLLPGFVFHIGEKCLGKKPMIMKIYRKMFFLTHVIDYFMSTEFEFSNKNTKKLLARLNPQDQNLFDFDMTKFSWNEITYIMYRSVCRYIMMDLTKYPSNAKELYKRKFKYINPIDTTIVWSTYVVLTYLGLNLMLTCLPVVIGNL